MCRWSTAQNNGTYVPFLLLVTPQSALWEIAGAKLGGPCKAEQVRVRILSKC